MEKPISPNVGDLKELWHAWDLRVCILISLFLQGLLVSTASYRKRTSNSWLERLIASSYSLVEWVSPYALGLIANKLDSFFTIPCLSGLLEENNQRRQPWSRRVSPHLLTFWAPFLLLHLGGPNNITYLSLDDNQMWLNHLVGLVSNVIAVATIFRRYLPRVISYQSGLFLPVILVFIAGFIKYVERTRALYLASSNSWEKSTLTQTKPNPGSDFEKLKGTHLVMREAHLPTEIRSVELPPKKMFKVVDLGFEEEEGPLDDRSLLKFAHCFYKNFKGFVGCLSFSLEQRQFTRRFFLKRTGRDAFKLLEMELSFLHDVPHVQSKNVFFTRVVISTSSIIAATLLFLVLDKSRFRKTDIFITYVLLLGAIVLEIISVFMIVMSDRFVIAFDCNWTKTIAAAIINKRRWSESISMCNLISHCIRGTTKPNKLPDHSLNRNLLERFKIIRTPTSDFVKDRIFNELKMKSAIAENVETATKICSQRGDWALMRNSCYSQLKWSLGEVEYGKSLLLWHIATDLCYCACGDNPDNELRFCNTISDYMLYLLVMKPTMMDPVADNWPQIFRDTSAEANRLFHKRSLTVHRQACEAILSVDTEFEPVVLKGDQSKSVLFDACRLAKQLMDREEPWKLMSGVWVELLGYAAVNCEATVHLQQPSQGGELLTFVWLLMNRLGLGMQFKEEPARTRYKLVVKK